MSHHVRIKICGVTDEPALQAAVRGGADFIGFVRWEGSPRHLGPEAAADLASMIPEGVEPVGLFVDAPIEEMLAWPHEWIQLHGRENEQVAEELRSEGHQIIRGFRFDPETVERWDRCPAVDRLVIDGSTVGGTGEAFDHDALKAMSSTLETPLLVAGGLTPTNVASLVEALAPWGVDVSSGVESARGRKDPDLIEAFCSAVRTASG